VLPTEDDLRHAWRLSTEARFSCGSLEAYQDRWTCNLRWRWLGLRGVAVVAYEKRCSKFWVGYTLTTRTPNAPPLRD
jgi:hypothetical protein